MQDYPIIYAIVVTWRGGQWYDKCFKSLRRSSVPVTTIVIDNASGDGSVEYIREHFPEVVVLPQNENLGFAKANNIGIRYALDHSADYIFLLNQDAWIEEDSLKKLLCVFDSNPDAGVVSPMHMNGAGNALDWKFATNMSGDFVSDAYMNSLKDNYEIRYVNAASWLISKDCIQKVGGFDTNLFVHYGEDIDYIHRVYYHHFKLYVCVSSRIYHDREFRKNSDQEYKERVFQRDELLHNMKLEYGNILYDIDIPSFINSNKKSIVKLLFKLRLKEAKKKKEQNYWLERILCSREQNKKECNSWL